LFFSFLFFLGFEKCILNLNKNVKLEVSVYKVRDVIMTKVLTCNIAIVKLRKIVELGPWRRAGDGDCKHSSGAEVFVKIYFVDQEGGGGRYYLTLRCKCDWVVLR
jgi:hypothetical protein